MLGVPCPGRHSTHQLEVSADGQTLTGRLVGAVVDGAAKAAGLARLAAQFDIDRSQVRAWRRRRLGFAVPLARYAADDAADAADAIKAVRVC